MKKIGILTVVFFFSIVSLAFARDELRHLVFELALENNNVKAALLPGVDLYFVGNDHPPVEKEFAISKSLRITNGFLKDKYDSCEWALASAFIDLQQAALDRGADGVINITSTLNNQKSPSVEQYDCLVGMMLVRVEIEGTIVKFAK
jgi:uncharacterized protein YbjQ (UPF0145 family)